MTKLPKKHVNPKYHNEGWLENLDEFKSSAVLTKEVQEKAQKVIGPGWKDRKPSAVLKALGLVGKSKEASFRSVIRALMA